VLGLLKHLIGNPLDYNVRAQDLKNDFLYFELEYFVKNLWAINENYSEGLTLNRNHHFKLKICVIYLAG
jgi:hypothetical protein